jgi:hypothetical protein
MAVSEGSESTAGAHEKRLAKWRNLAPAQTRVLIDGALDLLVPTLEAQGFERVGFVRLDSIHPTSGREIVMERVIGECVDEVTLNFDKFRRPRFQVQCSRRELSEPHRFIRSANLVLKSTQYYHFWGKPWWLPTQLWPDGASQRALKQVKSHLSQVRPFLESAERGPNISKPVHVTTPHSAA